jgi:hypothetical protein
MKRLSMIFPKYKKVKNINPALKFENNDNQNTGCRFKNTSIRLYKKKIFSRYFIDKLMSIEKQVF